MNHFYRRRLPHWQPPGSIFFVTFRTAGSLPNEVETQLRDERERIQKLEHSSPDRAEEVLLLQKRLFATYDKYLGQECRRENNETCFLREHGAASIVVECIKQGAKLKRFLLHRYCVMPNHVHILIEPLRIGTNAENFEPQWPPIAWQKGMQPDAPEEEAAYFSLKQILRGMKGASSNAIKRLLARSVNTWQDENFDHWVRNHEEYVRVIDYIDQNPVKAGLCSHPSEWLWSSVGELGSTLGK
jgi:putative transposase